MIRIQQLEPKQGEYTLHRERTPIDKVPIEQIWIGLRGQSVDFENIEQIVELTVDVATNGKFTLVRHCDVHQRRLLLEQGFHVAQDLQDNVWYSCFSTSKIVVTNFLPYKQSFCEVSSHFCTTPLGAS